MTATGRTSATPFAARPAGPDLVLLAVAVLGVSSSGPLMAAIAAPALAIALWRNVLGTLALAPYALLRHRQAFRSAPMRVRWLTVASGVVLAGHFATWVPAVTMTSVASATALVATQPVWNAVLARAGGQHVPGRAWLGIGVALLGVLVLTGIDVTVSREALVGDLLALVGGALAAVYTVLGAAARRTVSTTPYAATCYGVCSVVLLVGCLMGSVRLWGYPAAAWLGLVALTVLAQLLGHTLFNRVLGAVPPVVVSLAVLFEVPGAALLAAIFLGQVPPLAAIPAALLILAGVALVVAAERPEPATLD